MPTQSSATLLEIAAPTPHTLRMHSALTLLERLLRTRLWVVNVQRHDYKSGFGIEEGIVPTPRLLLARSGRARYSVEGRRFDFKRGMLLLIPARTRRSWRVPRGTGFNTSWVEFEAAGESAAALRHFIRPACNVALESECFERMRRLHASRDAKGALGCEGELKALLARFLCDAHMPGSSEQETKLRTFGEQAVIQALELLTKQYADPRALENLPDRVGLSPNHFRILFKKHFGLNAQRCLTTLRMRAARALLQETSRPVKEVARASGYADPLFFSRHYRAFWKRSPEQDRAFSP